MTTQTARGLAQPSLSDETVAQHLQLNPDFFERNSTLLLKLRLPHQRQSAQTVSLVERQVEVLRERNQGLERKLQELVEVARANDQLAEKIDLFARRLILAATLGETIDVIETSLREDFESMDTALILFLPQAQALQGRDGGFLRTVERDHPDMKTFETFLSTSRPRCGQIRDAQRDWLFGPNNIAIGSVALVPLGANCELGFLAVGSNDSERFHPAMSTEFLARLAEFARVALGRYR